MSKSNGDTREIQSKLGLYEDIGVDPQQPLEHEDPDWIPDDAETPVVTRASANKLHRAHTGSPTPDAACWFSIDDPQDWRVGDWEEYHRTNEPCRNQKCFPAPDAQPAPDPNNQSLTRGGPRK